MLSSFHSTENTTGNWPSILEYVQCVKSHAPLNLMGLKDSNTSTEYRKQQQVFTSHKHKPTVSASFTMNVHKVPWLVDSRAGQLIDIRRCQEALDIIHKDVAARTEKKREIRDKYRTRAIRSNHKLGTKWKCPKRIAKVLSDFVHEVVDIFGVEQKREPVHGIIMVLYRPVMEYKVVDESIIKNKE